MRANKYRVWDNKTKQFLLDVSQFTLKDLETSSESSYDFMQYTGEADGKGTDIYEGDIMAANSQLNVKGIVVYEDGQFRLWSGRGTNLEECFDLPILSKMFEVVGNIYENPEMIPPKILAEDASATKLK